ncbi:MAG: hypothetical protein ACYTEV_03525 [Planctomycetota bacterium]|jgi:hypothetical protein
MPRPSLDTRAIRAAARRTLPLLSLALAVLAAAIAVRPAAAQPSDGTVTAITAQEINAYAQRLGLTPTQRVALDPIHDAYKAEFDQLRARLIEPFMARQRELNMGGPAVTREAVEEMLEEQTRINGRVAQLDNRFFDQMAPLLSGPQQAMLPRVRLARERVRLQANQMMMAFGGAPADVSGMFARAGIRLTPEQLVRVDELLIPYEQRLTRRLGEFSELTSGMMLKMVNMMDEAGLLGMTQEEMMSDPERMQAVMETVQQAFAEIGRESSEKASEIRELNLTTYRRLLEVLPPRAGVALRGIFLPEAAPFFWFGESDGGPSGVWIEAMDVADLTAEQRATIDAELLAAYTGENQLQNTVLEEQIKVMSGATPMDMDMEAITAIQERAGEVGSTLLKRREEANTRVAALLGEDWRTRRTESSDEGSAVAGMPGGVGGFAGIRGMVVSEAGMDASAGDADDAAANFDGMLPDRIGGRTIRDMARRIGISPENMTILEALHQDYREAFAGLPSLETVRSRWASRWSGAGDEEDSADDRIRALNAARRTAFAEIAALEETFFDDLAATFGATPEQVQAIDLERLGRRLTRLRGPIEQRNWNARSGSAAGAVDLFTLIGSMPFLPAPDRVALAEPMRDYLNAAIPVAERLMEAALEMQEAEARWQQEMENAAEVSSAVDAVEISQRYQRLMGAAAERLSSIRGELAAANESAVTAMAAAMSPEGRQLLEAVWRESAFPAVYLDPLSVVNHFERALALEDLSSDVRRDLESVFAGYRGEWERLSAEMAEALRGRRMDMMNWQEVDWVEMQAFGQRMSALATERADGSIRAANQLRVLLDEGQLARIGGLPDPEDSSPGWMEWMY